MPNRVNAEREFFGNPALKHSNKAQDFNSALCLNVELTLRRPNLFLY
jgi:hypothetical protein